MTIGGLRFSVISRGFNHLIELGHLEVRGVRGDDRTLLINAQITAATIGRVQLRQVDGLSPTLAPGSLVAQKIDDYRRDDFRMGPVTDADTEAEQAFDRVGDFEALKLA